MKYRGLSALSSQQMDEMLRGDRSEDRLHIFLLLSVSS